VLTPRKRIPVIHWTEDRVDRRIIRDVLKKKKFYSLAGNKTPDCPKPSLVAADKIIKLVLCVAELRWGKTVCSCRNYKETSSSVAVGLLVSSLLDIVSHMIRKIRIFS
jgi:hypothetical protein